MVWGTHKSRHISFIFWIKKLINSPFKAWTKIKKVKTESEKVKKIGRTLFIDCRRKFARGYFSVDMFRAVPGEGGGAGVGGRSPHATLVPG